MTRRWPLVPYHELRDGARDKVKAALDGKPLAVACSAGNRIEGDD